MPNITHSDFHAITQYIIKDLITELHRLPTYMLICLPIFLAFSITCLKLIRHKCSISLPLFISYLAIMLNITFLEREMGSRVGISLKLFETMGGPQSNAYVLENILLFIPFGILAAHLHRKSRKRRIVNREVSDGFKVILSICGSIVKITLIGMVCSLGIETLQLITGKGYFQLDDIVMNTIGTCIGCVGYKIGNFCRRIILHSIKQT